MMVRIDPMNQEKLAKLLAKQSKTDLVQWIVDQSDQNEDFRRAVLRFASRSRR
jgi:hypothetical protein